MIIWKIILTWLQIGGYHDSFYWQPSQYKVLPKVNEYISLWNLTKWSSDHAIEDDLGVRALSCCFSFSLSQTYSKGLFHQSQLLGSFVGHSPHCSLRSWSRQADENRRRQRRTFLVPWNFSLTVLYLGMNPSWIMTEVVQTFFSSHQTLVIINKQFMRYSMSMLLCSETSFRCMVIKMSEIHMVSCAL